MKGHWKKPDYTWVWFSELYSRYSQHNNEDNMVESTLKQPLTQPHAEVPGLRVIITTKGWQRCWAQQTTFISAIQVKLNVHFVLETKTNSRRSQALHPLTWQVSWIQLFFSLWASHSPLSIRECSTGQTGQWKKEWEKVAEHILVMRTTGWLWSSDCNRVLQRVLKPRNVIVYLLFYHFKPNQFTFVKWFARNVFVLLSL